VIFDAQFNSPEVGYFTSYINWSWMGGGGLGPQSMLYGIGTDYEW